MNDPGETSGQNLAAPASASQPLKKRGMITRKPIRPPGPPLTEWQAVFVRAGKAVLWIGCALFVLGFLFLPGKHSSRGFEDDLIGIGMMIGGLLVAWVSSLIRRVGTRLTGAPREEEDEF